MIVNGVIISKDKNRYQIGEGPKLVKRSSGLTKCKSFWINKCKRICFIKC